LSKIKVLHINASSEGGASVVAQRLNEGLNRFSLDVESKHLVFSGHLSPSQNSSAYTLWADSFPKKVFAFFKHALDKLSFLRFEASKKVRFQFSHASQGIDISNHDLVQWADIIHLHWVHKGFQSFEALEKLLLVPGKKFIWTCHDLWPVTGGCYYTWGCENHQVSCGNCKYLKHPSEFDLSSSLIKRKMELWGNNQIKFVTPSNWLAQQANMSAVMKNNQIMTVIPNPIDTEKFQPLEEDVRQKLRAIHGFEKPLLMFSAAYLQNPAKGFFHFIEMCEILCQQKVEFEVLVLGDNKQEELGPFPFKCTHWGYVTDIEKVKLAFQLSDLYVITSVQDNLPTTIIESLSMGTPVAGFRVGGIPEMVEDGINGFLVESGDVSNLTQKVGAFLKNNRADFRNQARLKTLNTYDTKVIVNQITTVYKEL
jgi:glycosyltransferase involved in cell wall biosynthesis